MIATIRRAIDAEARLSVPAADLSPSADLYKFGLTPYSAIRMLLTLERELEVELPRRLLTRETLRSIDSLAWALRTALDAAPDSRAA